MRPKSNATVVVLLSWTPLTSSIPTPAEVMISSVLSGWISLTDFTIVVFPTPNPPTMTIFRPWLAVSRSGVRPAAGACSEVLEPNEHLLQCFPVGQSRHDGMRGWVANGDAAGIKKVT